MLSAFLAAVRIVLCWLDVTHRRKTALASGICHSVGDTLLSQPILRQCPGSLSGDGTPFAGPVVQMRCKTKVLATCSHDRFHSKPKQKRGGCPPSQIYLSMNKCDGKCPMTGRSGSLFSLCTLYTLLCAAGLQTKGLPHQETGSSDAAEQCLDSRLKILSPVLTLKLIIDFAWTLKFLDCYMECHKTVLSLVFFDWKMLSVRMLLVLRYLETVYWSRVGSICRMAKDRWIMYFVGSY